MYLTKLLALSFQIWVFLGVINVKAQSADWELDQMPTDLETDFALSALPPHLREHATVLLLDTKKGYYTARQGTNGFVTFITRTEWEWAEFSKETFSAISFDAEGARTLVPVFVDVEQMRATGKYTPVEIRNIVIKRIKDGTYKAPAHTGVSYMLAPLMRTHPGTKEVVNMTMPHYMFYAPNVTNAEIGGSLGAGPILLEGDKDLNDGHAIFNFIIVPAGETERNKIIEENKELLRRLAAFKPSLKVELKQGTHHH